MLHGFTSELKAVIQLGHPPPTQNIWKSDNLFKNVNLLFCVQNVIEKLLSTLNVFTSLTLVENPFNVNSSSNYLMVGLLVSKMFFDFFLYIKTITILNKEISFVYNLALICHRILKILVFNSEWSTDWGTECDGVSNGSCKTLFISQ